MSDSRELTTPAPRGPAVSESQNLLAQVIAAAKDPQVDAAKMETLARLVNSQQDRERQIEFNRDKNAAIMEMPVITKDGRIVITKDGRSREQGRFAKFEDIDRVCRPILASHNLAISFEMNERQGGGITVTPILSHANGHTERGGAFPVPAETSGSKNAAQAMGSSSSYGKRYAYCAILNIVTEGVDDDASQGRGISTDLPYERRHVVEREAKEAIEQGRYLEWFALQSPKDRGWLVDQPFHVEHGGQPRLEKRRPEPVDDGRGEPPPPPPPADDPEPEPTTRRGRSPQQMVEDFEKRLEDVTESRAVIDLQAEPKVIEWLEKLREREPELHSRVESAAARRYSALVAEERQAKRSQANEGQLFDE